MKITQASVLGLIGISSAATPSERRPRTVGVTSSTIGKNIYPLYETIVAPVAYSTGAASEQNVLPSIVSTVHNLMVPTNASPVAAAIAVNVANQFILKAAYYGSSPYACFRKNMYFFPTQYITAGKSGGADGLTITDDAVAAFTDATARTFWQHKESEAGTDFSAETKQINVWSPGPGGTGTDNKAAASSATSFYAKGFKGTTLSGGSALTGDMSKKGIKGYQFGDNAAGGASWACCSHVATQSECNGGLSISIVDGISAAISYRLVMKGKDKINDSTQTNLARSTMEIGSLIAIPAAQSPLAGMDNYLVGTPARITTKMDIAGYNDDLLLASMMQDSSDNDFITASRDRTKAKGNTAAHTVGKQYCDFPVYSFAKATTPSQEFIMSQGLNGATKCTYQLQVVDKTMAPGFKITQGDYRNYMIHWMEWLKDADLLISTATPIMNPAAASTHDTSVYKMGLYTNAFKFLNPLTGAVAHATSSWPAAGTAGGHSYANMQTFIDQSMWYPGSPGKVIWTPNKAGIMATQQHIEFDAGLISEMIGVTKAGVTSFNTAKTSYDALKTTYNTALKDEKARDAAATPDPIVIPVRPCPPSVPATYSGPSFTTWATTQVAILSADAATATQQVDITKRAVVAAASNFVLNKVQPYGTLDTTVTTVPATGFGNQWGYLQATDDTTAAVTSATAKHAGKSFGRLGQADSTMPDMISPWKWDQTAATANTATMMISFFPSVSTDLGLDDTVKKVKFTASQKAWGTYADYQAPTAPTAAVAPDAVSAVYLAATSTAAVALALATLY